VYNIVQLYNPNWDSLLLVLPHCCKILVPYWQVKGLEVQRRRPWKLSLARSLAMSLVWRSSNKHHALRNGSACSSRTMTLETTGGIQRVQLITPFILAGWADFIKIYKLVWPHVSSINRGFEYCLFGALLKRKLVKFAKQLSPHRFHCAATYRRKIADSHHVQVQLPPTQVEKKIRAPSDVWKMS